MKDSVDCNLRPHEYGADAGFIELLQYQQFGSRLVRKTTATLKTRTSRVACASYCYPHTPLHSCIPEHGSDREF